MTARVPPERRSISAKADVGDASAPARRPQTRRRRPRRRKKGTLTALDMALIVAVAVVLLLLAEPIWSVVALALQAFDIGNSALHMAGEITFTIVYACAFVGAFHFIGHQRRGVPWKRAGLVIPKSRALTIGLIAGIAAYTVVGLVDGTVSTILGRALVDNPRVFAEGYEATWYTTTLSLIVSTAIVPFIEELFFRGLLLGWLKDRIPVIPAVVFSAFAFAAYHQNWDYLLSLFAFALILSWVFLRTKSLWPAVLAHGAYNLVIDLYGYLSPG
jgi:membrane protease YdiL (CAAX protease family)